MASDSSGARAENPRYLDTQLITYLGNKRNLLDFIGSGISVVKRRLGKERLAAFDAFSGSGVVARYLKRHCGRLFANDLEPYSSVINECYLTNGEDFPAAEFREVYAWIMRELEGDGLRRGFIAEMYSPRDDERIEPGERVFYTARNARYIDTARQLIELVPEAHRKYLLAPLLSEASIHANTSGVFKGFHKNRETGIGQFGGSNRDALVRIRGEIRIPYPVLSEFSCEHRVFRGDANAVCELVPEVDVAYLDPPYNQHPYGSNYFMLNTILEYRRPRSCSMVSGIPGDWNRSDYNKARSSLEALRGLVEKLRAKFVLISFNSEGFIPAAAMRELLRPFGRLEVLETEYNTFRGSRNLSGRGIHLKEYLYVLERT